MATPNFDYVENQVRKKTFGIFTTIDSQNRPHSTGILYGVGPPSSAFALYILTFDHYAKVRYIRANPAVTLAVTFPHRILSFVPANCVTFRGHAVTVPPSDPDGLWAFQQHRILRDNLATVSAGNNPVFIRIDPEPKVQCHGLGIPLNQLRREHTSGGYQVRVPERP